MALNAAFLTGLVFPEIEHVVADSAAILYALSIGAGRDPLDQSDLRYVHERDLKICPTLPVVIGHPGNWMDDPRTGITRALILHGMQTLTNARQLTLGRPIIARNRVTGLADKGAERGAVIQIQRTLHDKATDALLSTMDSLVFCRGDGGFGGGNPVLLEPRPVPSRPPDISLDVPTAPNAALLYRLNHDRHPLHADPEAAAQAGFARPILHGLGTYGFTAHALCSQFPDRTIAHFECRFTRHVFPGDILRIEIWRDGDHLAVRTWSGEAIVLDHGHARLVEALDDLP